MPSVKLRNPTLTWTFFMIIVEDQGQTSALPVASENTDDLFAEEAAQGDGESAPAKNTQDADPKK